MSTAKDDGYLGKFDELYSVVLVEDLPQFELKAGDVGVIMMVYSPTEFTVEFNAEDGYLSALLDIDIEWLRLATNDDLKNRRSLPPNEFEGVVDSRPKARSA